MELLDRYIGHMYGPNFLALYLIVIFILYKLCRNIYLFVDRTSADEAPRIPSEPDPYVIAFLRKGPREVVKVILFNLLERGYVMASTSKSSLMQKKQHPPADNLVPIERMVFDWLKSSTRIEHILNSRSRMAEVEKLCTGSGFLTTHDDLYLSEDKMKAFRYARYFSILLIALLGLYKLQRALSTGHSNVFFLVVIGVVSLVVFFSMEFNARASRKGAKFIKDLETLYYPKYQQGLGESSYNHLLLASIFGFHLLHERGYSFLDAYPGNQTGWGSGGSGCSSGCGSSCGGGCGGGCGGCG